MKNILKGTLCLTILSSTLMSGFSYAEDFSYNYLEAAAIQSKVDKLDDEELSGGSIQGSFELSDNAYLKVLYAETDDDINLSGEKLSIDSKTYYLGIGLHGELNQSSDWYAELAAEKLKGQFVNGMDDFDDAIYSYSATLGLRKKLLEDAELEASLKHLYNQNGSEFSARFSAYYDVIDELAIGVHYEIGTEFDTVAASLRYSF
ncbi:hypothetical protein AADZ86_04790 [Colwelliaceae bacterium BS250]